MSRLIAFAAIQGAYNILAKTEGSFRKAMDKYGPNQPLAFPNTAYYLPIIYSILGIKVEKLGDAEKVLRRCRQLLPPHIKARIHLPYLGHTLDAGMAAILAEEIAEAIRYVEDPGFYLHGEDCDLENGKIWLGAADDVVMRKRGVEFVDGSAPGFAAIVGAAPTPDDRQEYRRGLSKEEPLHLPVCQPVRNHLCRTVGPGRGSDWLGGLELSPLALTSPPSCSPWVSPTGLPWPLEGFSRGITERSSSTIKIESSLL